MTAAGAQTEAATTPSPSPGVAATTPSPSPGVGVEVLELFAEVLSAGEDTAGNHFYDRLCAAVCRLAHMRRAIIFRHDAAVRRVRAAGAHGLDIARFADAHVTMETVPIAAEALASDRVVAVEGDIRGDVPPEYAELFPEPVRFLCAPMTAGGRKVGVILADRLLTAPPFGDAEQHLLWTLGKAAALASVSRSVATQAETARGLEHRLDLARDIHEGVIQRLFGVSMALDGEGDLPADARRRCAAETQTALADLRTALQRPLGKSPRRTGTTTLDEVARLARVYPELGVRLASTPAGGAVPAYLEPLAQSVLAEAVRNAHRHATPTYVAVSVERQGGAFVLEVVNDGVTAGHHQAGMGMRLAAFEALQSGGIVEFGTREPGVWQVRLVVPVDD
jgi:signal transduction histidine kinase